MASIHQKIGENLQVSPTCLMFFCDETGHELFADPAFPVFGFGGVAIMAGAIPQTISAPWRKMKAEHFGGADVPLHAADLRSPTTTQIAALTRFFKFQAFGRFSVALTSKTTVPGHLAAHGVISASIKRRWEELATRAG
jgi:hypothetical protein